MGGGGPVKPTAMGTKCWGVGIAWIVGGGIVRIGWVDTRTAELMADIEELGIEGGGWLKEEATTGTPGGGGVWFGLSLKRKKNEEIHNKLQI